MALMPMVGFSRHREPEGEGGRKICLELLLGPVEMFVFAALGMITEPCSHNLIINESTLRFV